MRHLIASLVVLFTVFSASSWAAAPSSEKFKELVRSYYTRQGVWETLLGSAPRPRPLPDPPGNTNPAPPPDSGGTPRPPQCPPSTFPGNCVEAVCSQLSRFDCDERDELLEVARECRNSSGDCVRNICGRISRFDCDDKSEVFEVVRACRGLIDISCIDYVCSRVSRFDCDELSELLEIARQCRQ